MCSPLAEPFDKTKLQLAAAAPPVCGLKIPGHSAFNPISARGWESVEGTTKRAKQHKPKLPQRKPYEPKPLPGQAFTLDISHGRGCFIGALVAVRRGWLKGSRSHVKVSGLRVISATFQTLIADSLSST
jgi:hypothetical protein